VISRTNRLADSPEDRSNRFSFQHEGRGDVQVEQHAPPEAVGCRDGGPKRHNLESETEADSLRRGELFVGGHAVLEPGQRLVADDPIALEIHDRLEDRVEGEVIENVDDALACVA